MFNRREFIRSLTNYLSRTVTSSSTFGSLNKKFKDDKVSFTTVFDYDEAFNKGKEIKDILNKITSIIYKPHIKTTVNEIIKRSELAAQVSNEAFNETLKDSKLWKNKRGVMTPEYVHTIEHVDTIETYENHFIAMLVDYIEDEVNEILNELTPLIYALEEKYENYNTSLGDYSLLNSFNKENISKEIFAPVKSDKAEVFKLFTKLKKKILIIKDTQFYKTLSKHPLKNKNILPTNILIHDELYSYCYRFYKENYLGYILKDEQSEVYYYNYFVISLIDYLLNSNEIKSSTLGKLHIYMDHESRIHIPNFKIRKGLFIYTFSESLNGLGLSIEVEYLFNNDQTSNYLRKEVDAFYKNKINLYTSYSLTLEGSEALFHEVDLKNFNVNNVNETNFVVTMKNFIEHYDNVITFSIYRDNHLTIFKNIFKSLTLLFECEASLYEVKCPVCGRPHIVNSDFSYICEDCLASYSILINDSKNILWIKSLRRN